MPSPSPEPSTSANFTGIKRKRKSSGELESLTDRKKNHVEETSSRKIPLIEGDTEYPTGGLKHTLHGNSFQLKLLTLFVHIGVKNNYAFRLATEHSEAGKFDDLIFQYRKTIDGKIYSLFLQAKHSRIETRKIKASNLKAVNEDDFSLRKYFISYSRIALDPSFKSEELKEFVICTNIDFDYEDCTDNEIPLVQITAPHDFLNSQSKNATQYKLGTLKADSELFKILEKTSDGHILANALAKNIYQKKTITLNTNIFKLHLRTLVNEGVIDQVGKTFTTNFKNDRDLSEWAKEFRSILCAEFIKHTKFGAMVGSMEDMWTKIENEERLCLVKDFEKQLQNAEENEPPDFEPVDIDSINNFLDNLVFVVNQPDEVELGRELIRRLADVDDVNLKDPYLAYTSLLNKMEDWIKAKEGVWLTRKDGKKFFTSIREEINTLITSGLSLSYLAEIEKYGIEFDNENEGLKEFLSPNSARVKNLSALNLIAKGDTLLTMIRTYQTIRKTKRYKKQDSFIFVRLDTLFESNQIKRRVIRAFRRQLSQNLVVIDCGSGYSELSQKLKRIYEEVKNSAKGKAGKKLIFVTPESEKLPESESDELFADCREEYDEVSFGDLTETSRKKLLNKPNIIFQGSLNKISFQELFEISSPDETTIRESPNFQNLIDSSTLLKLIRDQEIKVGKRLEELGDLQKIYVDRQFYQHFLKADILTLSSPSDVFAISHISRKKFMKLPGSEKNSKKILLTSDNGGMIQQFAMLCEKNPNTNVHWLKFSGRRFIWKQSRGNVTNLLKYVDTKRTNLGSTPVFNYDDTFLESYETQPTCLSEDELIDHNKVGNVVIIHDDSGSGKTTLFTSLAKKLKKKDMKRWVIRINLNDVVHELDLEVKRRENGLNDGDSSRLINFFLNNLSGLETDLEKKFLREIIENRGGVIVLCDGFDEIVPYYEELGMDLLQALKTSNGVEKIFISTRPIMKQFLEAGMEVFSYTMESLTSPERLDLLNGFFHIMLGLAHPETQIKNYASDLINSLCRPGTRYDLLDIPIHLRILAEIYQDDAKESYTSSCAKKLSDSIIGTIDKKRLLDFMINDHKEHYIFSTFEESFMSIHSEIQSQPKRRSPNVIDLFESFIDKKCRIDSEEKERNIQANARVRLKNAASRDSFRKKHEELALYALLEPADLDTLLPDWREKKSIKSCIDNVNPKEYIPTGLITHLVGGKPKFAHRSFAEYFLASLLVEKLEQAHENENLLEFLVKRILLAKEFYSVRVILAKILENKFRSRRIEDKDKASAASAWISVINKHRSDEYTIFDIAEREENLEIIKFVLDPFLPLDKSWKDLIFVKPNGLPWIEHIQKMGLDTDLAEYYIEKCGIHPDEIRMGWLHSTPLSVAMGCNNWRRVQWLVKNGADPRAKDGNGSTPLTIAMQINELPILKWFIAEGVVDVDYIDEKGRTLLHLAAKGNSPKICTWLVEEKHADLKAIDNNAKSAFDLALDAHCWKVLNWFVQKLGGQYKFNDGSTIVDKASNVFHHKWNAVWVHDPDADENPYDYYPLDLMRDLIREEISVTLCRSDSRSKLYSNDDVTDEMLDFLEWLELNRKVNIFVLGDAASS